MDYGYRSDFFRKILKLEALLELESYMDAESDLTMGKVIEAVNPEKDVMICKENKLFDYSVLVSGRYDEAVSTISDVIIGQIDSRSTG